MAESVGVGRYMKDNRDEVYMRRALREAEEAFEIGEVPIGAALVLDGAVIAAAHNLREAQHDATAHAELLVIRQACAALGRWRLTGGTLYVTVEPCPMCAGALVMSRIARVVYGVPDSKAGAVESLFNIVGHPALNHRVEVTAGVLEDECRALLQHFFQARRQKREMGKGKKSADST